MTSEGNKAEIEKLVHDLNYHCYRYYVLDQPVITDSEYDRLYRRLKELEEKTGYLMPDSPTQRVGAPPLDKFVKVKHAEPMLSLENAFSHDEIRDFDKRVKKLLNSDDEIEYTVEPKYDGLAMEITYRQGMLFRASTRGDGQEGEDVTQNIKTIKSVPLKIENISNIPEEIDIRGEVYINLYDFEQLNKQREEKGEPTFANPRNAAAGSVRQLDPAVTISRKLHLACYGIGAVAGIEFSTQSDLIKWFEAFRFPVPLNIKKVTGIENVIDAVKQIEGDRKTFPFETDGAVIKVNDFGLQKKLGLKTREPRWAIAYKFQAHQGTTKIIDIQGSVGRTGVITPFAVFEPVRIGGVTVSRSTLHNWDEIGRKDIRVGDTVVVERAGDVIPHVVMVKKEERTGDEKFFPIPEKCPSCGSKVMKEEGEVAVRCVSLHCPAQVREKILHFSSRPGMDIEGLGEKNVELLYSEGLIKHFEDIYGLREEDLLNLPRFAKKSANNLITAIERSKKTTLARFLFAIGIMHVGEYASKILAGKFKNLEDLYHIKPESILHIKQMGVKIAASLCLFFNDENNIRLLCSMLDNGFEISNPDYKTEQKEDRPLDGLTFVITGTMPKPRKEVKDLISRNGGHVASAVSANSDYLVTGEEAGSKLKKAEALGVKIIQYDQLLAIIDQRTKNPRLF